MLQYLLVIIAPYGMAEECLTNPFEDMDEDKLIENLFKMN